MAFYMALGPIASDYEVFFLAIKIKKFLHNMQFVRDYQYNAIQHTCQILLFAYQM